MVEADLEVPVVLIVFNRPDHTRAVFERIAAARPRELFVIADGPRKNNPEDMQKCHDTRAIVEQIDWPCELHTDFAEHNIGCGKRIAEGLDSVFEHVDRAIILEDDCVPERSFFRFAAELLYQYEDDGRVRTISGNNFLFGKARTEWSYHFSMIHNTWGWATWRRSWTRMDMAMRLWPEVRDGGWLLDLLGDERAARFWAVRFDRTHQGHRSFDAWDYPYLFSCWLDRGVAITPNRNLVSNRGFGADATHTMQPAKFMGVPTEPMPFPLIHPPFMICDRVSDHETFKGRCLPEEQTWLRRAARRIYQVLTKDREGAALGRLGRGRLTARRALSADL